MNLQDALVKAIPEAKSIATSQQVTACVEFSDLYDKHIGRNQYCPVNKFPPIVAQAYEKMLKAQNE